MKSYNKMFNPGTDGKDVNARGMEPKVVAEGSLEKTVNNVVTVRPKDEIVTAVVTNCKKLNVRESSSRSSNIICVISEGDMVTISPIYNVIIADGWTHIETDNGTRGYIMVEYIKEV